MNYINIFQTESSFNDVSNNLSLPQLSYIIDTDKVFNMSEAYGPSVEMVDLGLSVKWAKYNVGATCETTSDSWYGTFFAWGETEGKQYYSWDNYKYGKEMSLTKYNNTDGKTILDLEDDAAYTIQTIRMPTKAEFEELLDNSKIDITYKNDYQGITGLEGLLLTSKVPGYEGNYIFIPECGIFGYVDFHGYCWTSSLNQSDRTTAYRLNFINDDIFEERLIVQVDTVSRKDGFPVRGVQDKN